MFRQETSDLVGNNEYANLDTTASTSGLNRFKSFVYDKIIGKRV